MKAIFLALTVFLVTPEVASALPQTYRIGWYQAADATCPSEARAIADRFAAATGRTVLAATCERPFSWKLDVVIQYEAPAEQRLYSTFDEFAMDQGTYATKESCEAELDDESALFAEKTGLDVVVAYCYPESSLREANHFPFIARIDGFGTPRLKPFTYDGSFYHKPWITQADIESRVIDTLDAVPEVVSPRVRTDYAYNGGRIAVKYYAKREMPLALESQVSFESAQLCELARSSFEELLTSFGLENKSTFCGQEQFADTTILYFFGFTTGFYSVEKAVDRFSSRVDCEAALPAIEERYETTTASTQVRGVCSFERPDILANPVFLPKIFVAR